MLILSLMLAIPLVTLLQFTASLLLSVALAIFTFGPFDIQAGLHPAGSTTLQTLPINDNIK